VKSFQVLHLSNVVVGGAHLNHFSPIPPGSSAVEMGKLLKDYVNGHKYEEPAAEIKVCVISFQDMLPGMCPYFTLVGRPHTVNENNYLRKKVMDACVTACSEDGSSVVLNTTTYGVASKVQWNLCAMVGFLSGSMNHVSLPDTNHNVKNARYQLIDGLLCAVIGSYVLDPWYLKMAGIHQTLWRLEDR
jgi:hypothetical protein